MMVQMYLFPQLWNILNYGIHSGDSACILPSKHIPMRHLETIKEYTKKIAKEMNVRGLMNMQYAIADDKSMY
ncbi:MAG: hypothetical protein ACLRHW_12475 [Coprobacillus cateniformis]